MGSKNAHPTTIGSNVQIERLLKESQRYFPSDWLDRFHTSAVETRYVGRGYYNGRVLAVSDSNPYGRRSTMVHELFHRAEDLVPGVAQTEKQLYLRRKRRSKRREIDFSKKKTSLKPNEREYTRRDSWLGNRKNGPGEYMGKEYSVDFFEIGTMSMEGIIFGSIRIENDREVMDLVLGILAVH